MNLAKEKLHISQKEVARWRLTLSFLLATLGNLRADCIKDLGAFLHSKLYIQQHLIMCFPVL
jgi:hypothetical protein